MAGSVLEESNILNSPIECFYYDSSVNSFPVKPHWHYYMEIIYMLEGRAEMHSDDFAVELAAGSMIIFHPKSVHSIYAVGDGRIKYAVLKFDIGRFNENSAYAPKLRSIFKSAQNKGLSLVIPKEYADANRVPDIFHACIREINERRYNFDLMITSNIYELLIIILRCWQEQGFWIDEQVYNEDNNYDIYNVTEYIDRNISNGIKVSEVAEHCKMSYSCFAKKFLAVYGKTCKEYIEHMRLYKVEEFLAFTDFDLNYISQETGYSDCSHMIKSFKNSRGITPKQFRLKHRTHV